MNWVSRGNNRKIICFLCDDLTSSQWQDRTLPISVVAQGFTNDSIGNGIEKAYTAHTMLQVGILILTADGRWLPANAQGTRDQAGTFISRSQQKTIIKHEAPRYFL